MWATPRNLLIRQVQWILLLTDSTWMNAECTSWCGCESEAFPWRPKLTHFINVALTVSENWSWARAINGRDRGETETSPETETLTIFLETRRCCTSRDRLETETSRQRPQPCKYIDHSHWCKRQDSPILERIRLPNSNSVTDWLLAIAKVSFVVYN